MVEQRTGNKNDALQNKSTRNAIIVCAHISTDARLHYTIWFPVTSHQRLFAEEVARTRSLLCRGCRLTKKSQLCCELNGSNYGWFKTRIRLWFSQPGLDRCLHKCWVSNCTGRTFIGTKRGERLAWEQDEAACEGLIKELVLTECEWAQASVVVCCMRNRTLYMLYLHYSMLYTAQLWQTSIKNAGRAHTS